MADVYLGNEKKNRWCIHRVFTNEPTSWLEIPSGDWEKHLSHSPRSFCAPECSVSQVKPLYTKPWQLTLKLSVIPLSWRENCVSNCLYWVWRQTVLWKWSGREGKCCSDPRSNTLEFRNLCSSTAHLYIFITTVFLLPIPCAVNKKIRQDKRIKKKK